LNPYTSGAGLNLQEEGLAKVPLEGPSATDLIPNLLTDFLSYVRLLWNHFGGVGPPYGALTPIESIYKRGWLKFAGGGPSKGTPRGTICTRFDPKPTHTLSVIYKDTVESTWRGGTIIWCLGTN
jgi:hypothetical protein